MLYFFVVQNYVFSRFIVTTYIRFIPSDLKNHFVTKQSQNDFINEMEQTCHI